MRLTELLIKNTPFTGKTVKLFDGGGLYLLINCKGRYWRYKYRFCGREKSLALGIYPNINLRMAREAHREARILLDKGKCPATEKQRIQQGQMQAERHHTVFRSLASSVMNESGLFNTDAIECQLAHQEKMLFEPPITEQNI